MPRVSSSSLSSTPCPGLATEHFTVLALVRYVCLTLMTFAVYSFEFGLYHDKFQTMMTGASLTAFHYMRQTLMISAIIYSFEFGLRLRPKSKPSASAAHRPHAAC